MKKLLLGALAITIASCTNTAPVDYALFSGTIKNSESKKLIIRNSENKSIREITLSDTGVFSDTIFNAGGYVSFFNGKESSAMYVKNGDNITLNMDAKEFDETVAYTGSAASNFLAQKFLVKEKSGSVKDLYSLDEAAYLSKMNTQKETLEKSLTGLDADFVKQEKVNLKYDHIAHVKDYQPAHRYFAKKKDFKVSESFPDVLEGIDYSNEDHFKSSAAYKGLVMNNFYKMVGEKSKKNETSFSEAAIAYIKTSKSALMNNAFLSAISREVSGGNSKMKELYTDIMALSTDDDFKKKLTKQYEKALKISKR